MEFVGRTVGKKFKGSEACAGVVNSYDPSTGSLEVVYEDGDSEDLEFSEVALLLELEATKKPCRVGRKPRKRRRSGIRGDSGNSCANLMSDSCLTEVILGQGGVNQKGIFEILENGCGVGDNLKETLPVNGNLGNGLNLNDELDLNDGFNLNDGFDLNVNGEERLKKTACIDLNMDANGDLEENVKEGDQGVSVVGTQKRKHCFDLNLGLDGEIKNSDVDFEVQLKENTSFHVIEETQKQEMSRDVEEARMKGDSKNELEACFEVSGGTQMEAIGRSVENVVRDSFVGLMEEVQKENGVSGGLEGGDTSGPMDAKDFRSSEVRLNEGLHDTGSSLDHVYQGNSGSTCKERKRRKRRILPDNVNSATETVLRRSRRRLAEERTEKREHCFDLNLGLDEEIKNSDADHVVENAQNRETGGVVEDTQMEGDGKNGEEACFEGSGGTQMEAIDSGVGLIEVQIDNGVSEGWKGGDTPGSMDANDFMPLKDQIKEGLPDTGTPLPYGYQGNSGSTCKGKNRREKRKLSDNVYSATDTLLRRSSRRLAATFSSQNHVSSGAMFFTYNEAHASLAVSAVLEEQPTTSGREESEEYTFLPSKLQLPPSSGNLNLDGIPILDLFSVYACLRSFSTLLFLSPFELEDFVAAVRGEVPNLLFDFIHVSLLQTLRKHLEFLSDENSLSASSCLRSVNWDLLDLITWPVFMAEYLLTHGSGLKPGFDLCKLKLFESDYYKQPAVVKIEILRCLCDDVIEVEAIRSEINRRTLATELNMDIDRSMRVETSKKRTSMDVSGGSFLTEEEVDVATDWNSDECCLCKMDGSLICCDGCPAAYHLKCVGVANSLLPEGDWYCPECVIDKDKPWLKLEKSLRGAELLGVDPYGRLYYSSCGYLLVSDSCDNESSYHYYHINDLTFVIDALKSSDTFFSPILGAISKQWNICINSNGAKCDVDCKDATVCSELVKRQMLSTPVLPLHLAPSETFVRDEIIDERKPEENSIAAQYSGNTDCEVSSLVNNNLLTLNNSVKIGNPLKSCEVSAEISQTTGIKKGDRISSMMLTRRGEISQGQLGTGYVNYYSFARTASLVAEELTRKSSDKSTDGSIKSVEDIISAQLKAISKKSTKFSWPNIQTLNADARKEKCGWCFSCKAPDDDKNCFFNMNDSVLEGFTGEVVGIRSKRNTNFHLIDVMSYILSIEDRLHGFLLGPWLNPHYTKLWRDSVVKASDVASLKHFLLMLESNLRRLALSAEWLKHVDSNATMGSASHIVISSQRVSSKHGIGRKRARLSDLEPKPSSNAATGLGLFWWRGGRLSRELFNWKVLPRSMASKVARQAGRTKIPGVLYSDSSEFAKRSKYVVWRAAVETSISVEQLALQVRELDANIRWDDIENTNILSKMDQFRKSVRPFKKVIIRRKSIEGTVVKYLLDFGKRRIIPDIVVTQGTKVEESSSGRKKYWLEESHVPLYLLKSFEERRIARKSNKMSPKKLQGSGRVTKKTSKKRGFSYLFAKAERSENYQCGHCNKDVLIREAVSCQYCKGFFHKRHVKKSAGAVTARCKYTCHKCQDGDRVKVEAKKGKSQSQKSKKASTVCRVLRSKISKKPAKDQKPSQQQKNRKIAVVLPLRRSARKAKCVTLQNKKVGGRKKGKGKGKANGKAKQIKPRKEISKKPKEGTWKKKRTPVYHTYWLSGLLLSRKPNDERVMHFRSKKLIVPSEQITAIHGEPKCSLCCEQEFSLTLNYVGCEICGDWFHGDAFGLGVENIDNLIGFKCHKCRDRTPPICPHFHRKTIDEALLVELNNTAGTECAEEVSNIVAIPTEGEEEHKFHTGDESKKLWLGKDPELGTVPDSNDLNAKNSHLPVSVEQKGEAIQIPSEAFRPDLSMESNEHVSLEENMTDLGTVHIGAVTTFFETEFPLSKSDVDVRDTEMVSVGHDNAENDSAETMDSNEHVLLVENTTDMSTEHIGVVTCVETEFPSSKSDVDVIDTELVSMVPDNVETDLAETTSLGSLAHKTLADSSEVPPQAIVASGEIVDGGEKVV
ncbi:DDT domain-containing protein PTM [Camellia lanceoleosa]|uniref:DDT domain-containing protein PTM n=1 Tax=Camellia lanceoleosa TaxID=1840588 RepID=A0ACC0F1Q9_9ERIC|nr:DDT domain-containing protein PTM [Camellia lanceoleosa]